MSSPHERASAQNSSLHEFATNHNLRNSPPFQPGEQAEKVALPGIREMFRDELSPPHTPAQSNNSPGDRPQWSLQDHSRGEPKRKRSDTVTDIGIHRLPNTSIEHVYDTPYAAPKSSIYTANPPPPSNSGLPPLPYRPTLPPLTPGFSARPPSPPQYPRHPPAPSYNLPPVPPSGPPMPVHQGPPAYRCMTYAPPRLSYFGEAPRYQRGPQDPYYPHDDPRYPMGAHGGYGNEPPYHHPLPYNHYTFQSNYGMDHQQKKRRGNLPKEATAIMKAWYNEHEDSPYPTEEEKHAICSSTRLSLNQVSNWFINARRRAPGRENRNASNSIEEDESEAQP